MENLADRPALTRLRSKDRDSTASLVDLAMRCELDERQDLTSRPVSALSRPKSKPSDLNLAALDEDPQPPAKKRTVGIVWKDLKKLKFLGEGAHCTVHSAEYNGKQVAVKRLKNDLRRDAVAVRDIEVEGELMTEMSHKHVLRVHGRGIHDGTPFIVMDRLQTTLSQKLVASRSMLFFSRAVKKHLPLEEALGYALQLARAMVFVHDDAFAHHQLLHRDLKPDNIGIAEDGTVKLFDFGLAKLIPRLKEDDLCPRDMTGKTGSARYMAPEVALSKPYNTKADVYSFAMIMYEMLAHEKPFLGMDMEMLYTDVFYGGFRPSCSGRWPKALTALIQVCWHHHPARRPHFRDIVKRLEEIQRENCKNAE